MENDFRANLLFVIGLYLFISFAIGEEEADGEETFPFQQF